MIGKVRPRDRSEEEVSGYRRALDWIFVRKGIVKITPAVIRKLHSMAQGGTTGDAGDWKQRDNEIIEILPNGERLIRFVPTSAEDTPRAVELLCGNYSVACVEESTPPLILIATFVFDFLCIHPFHDGNGRVLRLLTTLLLVSHGFEVSRYVSLERLVEQSMDDYYRVLGECSKDLREGRNEITPWWNYLLGIIRTRYKEFGERIENLAAHPAKSDLVEQTILEQVGEFTLADLVAEIGAASPQLVKKVLSELKAAGRVRLDGRGRGARWVVAG